MRFSVPEDKGRITAFVGRIHGFVVKLWRAIGSGEKSFAAKSERPDWMRSKSQSAEAYRQDAAARHNRDAGQPRAVVPACGGFGRSHSCGTSEIPMLD